MFKSREKFLNFVENDKIIHWFSQNSISKHPKITQMPIGLDYHTMSNKDSSWGNKQRPVEQEKVLEMIKNEAKPIHERKIMCYSNFHFTTSARFGYDRIDAIAKIPKICVYYEENKINRRESWQKQSEYAFVISPHGNGLDCHRTWEALCLNCIPIVKTSPLDNLYIDLPVLIVNEWNDISMELLEKTANDFKDKTFNYDKLTLQYWMDKINDFKK